MEFRGKNVTLSGPNQEEIINSHLFKQWLSSINEEYELKSVEIQSFIHNNKNELTYIKLNVLIVYNGANIPRYIWLCGPTIAILPYFENNGEKNYVLKRRPYIVTGNVLLTGEIDFIGDQIVSENIAASYLLQGMGIDVNPSRIVKLYENETLSSTMPGPLASKLYTFTVKLEKDEVPAGAIILDSKSALLETKDVITQTLIHLIEQRA